MTGRKLHLLAPLFLAPLAVAAPMPEGKRVPITADNADQVRQVAEVEKSVYRIAPGPGRGELTLLDWNKSVEVVDDDNLRTLRTYAKDRQPTDFAASPDGKLVAWTERNSKTYTVEDPATGKSLAIEPGDNPGFAAFSPDGKLLALGSVFWQPNAEGVGTSEMKLYEAATGKLVHSLGKFDGPGAQRPVFSPDGKLLAVGNRNYETRIFDAATGKLLQTLDKRMTQEVAFSPDGKTIACGYVDGTIALWDVATGKLLRSEPSTCREVYSVAWSPKGDLLATSGRSGSIVLWDPATLKKLKVLEAPIWVIQVRFTADGTRLLTSSASNTTAQSDRKIVVWGVGGGK